MNNSIGYIINESSYLMEDVDIREDGDRVIAKGVLQTGDEKNRNGRIYRTEDLAREIQAPRQRELLAAKQMLGHAGHPLSSELVVQQTIDPKLACVSFLKFWMEGNNVKGIFKGTNNDLGDTFDKDLRQGVKPAFSLRALGTVKATPQGALVENLKMITYDYVIYPSHPHAYTEGLLNESASMDIAPASNFKFTNNMDADKSFVAGFTNQDALNAMHKRYVQNESAIDYIKDKSFNYHLLKEFYDMTKIDTVDLVSPTKIALTEAGNATIIMNVEDYIAKEIQNYSH
jgi:hypothetical protein